MTNPKLGPRGGLSSFFDTGFSEPPRLGGVLGPAAERQVTEISKPDGADNPHERITALHGVDENNKPWSYPAEEVLRLLALPEWRRPVFFVLAKGQKVKVIREQGSFGPYLKTEADGFWQNNLLALPNRLG